MLYLQSIINNLDLIEKLENPKHKAVLLRRYVGLETWETIAKELDYTVRHVIILHNQAISILDNDTAIKNMLPAHCSKNLPSN